MDRRERERVREMIRTENQVRSLFGRVAAVLRILVAAIGDLSPSDVGPAGPIGLVMGMLGYALGARRLGTAAIVLSVAEVIVGFIVG